MRDFFYSLMFLMLSLQMDLMLYAISHQRFTCTETVRVGLSTYCSEYKVGRE